MERRQAPSLRTGGRRCHFARAKGSTFFPLETNFVGVLDIRTHEKRSPFHCVAKSEDLISMVRRAHTSGPLLDMIFVRVNNEN